MRPYITCSYTRSRYPNTYKSRYHIDSFRFWNGFYRYRYRISYIALDWLTRPLMKAVLFGCWMWRYGGYGGGILNMIQACALACACQHDHDFQNAIKLIVQRQCFEFSGIQICIEKLTQSGCFLRQLLDARFGCSTSCFVQYLNAGYPHPNIQHPNLTS